MANPKAIVFNLGGRIIGFPENCSILTTVVETNREKDAATMAYMNMILIGTLKDNIKYDILLRNRFLIHYFVLF